MVHRTNLCSVIALATALSLAACSGGDGNTNAPAAAPPPVGGPPPAPPPPPTSGAPTNLTVGTITGFGSVFVNGQRFETDGETVVAMDGGEGTMGDDSALRLGQQVVVFSSDGDGGDKLARRIEADTALRGAVDMVMVDDEDPMRGTLSIAGQTVAVDANTIFGDNVADADGMEGVDLRDLDPAVQPDGEPIVVEVSGLPTDFGLLATRIEADDIAASALGQPGGR